MSRGIASESDEQALVLAWAELQDRKYSELKLLFAVPNGGSRNKIEAVRLKREGVKAGVPDMILPVARGGYHSLAIELKRTLGGRVSEEQKAWLEALNAQGWYTVVCNGAMAAVDVIQRYLKGEITLDAN